MELNQDIIPQISFSIRAGLGERPGGEEEEGGGYIVMINQKIESCCLKPVGSSTYHFHSSLRAQETRQTQRHLSVGSETAGLTGLPGLVITTPQWAI